MRVVVAGAGAAGLETLVALRALAGARVALTLLAPVDSFAYRPLSTAVPFSFRAERRISMRALADGVDAGFVQDGLAQVDTESGRVLTRNGDFLPFDAVVLAMGVRHPARSAPGLRWSRGPGGPPLFGRLLREIEAGESRSIAFVVPTGAAWPPDAYELALIAARAGGEVTVLTGEREPLEALGQPASETVRRQLAEAGIELRTGVELSDGSVPNELGKDAFSAAVARLTGTEDRVRRAGGTILGLGAGETLRVDRTVSLPAARGPAPAGVAHDAGGFIPVDGGARVAGADRLLAVGDATTVRLKHSAIAAAQANAAAETIAAEAGAEVDPTPWSPVLYGILADPPHFPGPPDSVWLDGGEPITHCLWWPPGHVTGRHLAPYIAARDPVVRTGLLWHPRGVPVAAKVAGAETAEHPPPNHGYAGQSIEADAHARQLLAIRRAARAGERSRRRAKADGDAFDRRERDVIARLQAAGYLRHAGDEG
jgi:sulfide:quinone oxidoreductase